MECPFQVGDEVVCVFDFNTLSGNPHYELWRKQTPYVPELNGVYHVRTVELEPVFGKPSIRLMEIVNPLGLFYINKAHDKGLIEAQFHYVAFQPARKRTTSIETFTDLLVPTKPVLTQDKERVLSET